MLNSYEQDVLREIENRLLEDRIAEVLHGRVSLNLKNYLGKNNFSIVSNYTKDKIIRILKFKYKELIEFLKKLSNENDLRDTGIVLVEKNNKWEITDVGNGYLKKLEDFIKNTDEEWLKEELDWIKTSIEAYLVYEMGEGAFSNVISVMYSLAKDLEKEEV